jgi:hypothetical protein
MSYNLLFKPLHKPLFKALAQTLVQSLVQTLFKALAQTLVQKDFSTGPLTNKNYGIKNLKTRKYILYAVFQNIFL